MAEAGFPPSPAGRSSNFWKKHAAKLPGGLKVIPRETDGPTIGARFPYTSLVVSGVPMTFSRSSPASPTRNLHHDGVLHRKRSSSPLPPMKRFQDFMNETAAEWGDEIDELEATKDAWSIENLEKARVEEGFDLGGEGSTNVKTRVEARTVRPNPSGIKKDINGLVEDPSHTLRTSTPVPPDAPLQTEAELQRVTQFKEVLQSANVDLPALRKLSWNGIPEEFRPMAWQLLLGYLPCNQDRRKATLARKRKDYEEIVASAYAKGLAGLDQTVWHQIHIDIPRTNPGIKLYQCEATQQCLERILYCYAIRHPASGYVQGINDLVTPFFQVFLGQYIDGDPEVYDMDKLPKELQLVIEADCYWCLTKLLEGIQTNYTFAQREIQKKISSLKKLVVRIDKKLADHLEAEGIEYIQFAFRWMNCLLMRELSVKNTIRMWDTYLSEADDAKKGVEITGFSEFHLYVCAAFLVKWSDHLKKLDFQGIMMFLQNIPTQTWGEKDIKLLLSEAFMWKSLFHNAPNHLTEG